MKTSVEKSRQSTSWQERCAEFIYHPDSSRRIHGYFANRDVPSVHRDNLVSEVQYQVWRRFDARLSSNPGLIETDRFWRLLKGLLFHIKPHDIWVRFLELEERRKDVADSLAHNRIDHEDVNTLERDEVRYLVTEPFLCFLERKSPSHRKYHAVISDLLAGYLDYFYLNPKQAHLAFYSHRIIPLPLSLPTCNNTETASMISAIRAMPIEERPSALYTWARSQSCTGKTQTRTPTKNHHFYLFRAYLKRSLHCR